MEYGIPTNLCSFSVQEAPFFLSTTSPCLILLEPMHSRVPSIPPVKGTIAAIFFYRWAVSFDTWTNTVGDLIIMDRYNIRRMSRGTNNRPEWAIWFKLTIFFFWLDCNGPSKGELARSITTEQIFILKCLFGDKKLNIGLLTRLS